MSLPATAVPSRTINPSAQPAALSAMSAATAQLVYRTCLNALARPGMIKQLKGDWIPAGYPAAVAPMLALTDLMAPLAGLGRAAEIARAVGAVTGAACVPPAEARYALALDENPDPRGLSVGTALAPQNGSMLCQRVASISVAGAGLQLSLTGPGVKGSRQCAVAGLSEVFFAARAQLVEVGPTGIDVLLITDDGVLVGIPRTTRIEVTR